MSMLTEQQAILYLFEYHFGHWKNKKIVLYGNYETASLIMTHFEEYHILGRISLHDDDSLRITFREASQADVIIVINKENGMQQAFNDIYFWCKKLHMPIYGLNGKNLLESLCYSRIESPRSLKFREQFCDCLDDNFALYGKGPIARSILESLPEFNIVGLLDKNEDSGEQYGKKFLTYEEVIRKDVSKIIVAAKEENQIFIFNRIKKFCERNSIGIYNVSGEDLFVRFRQNQGENIHEVVSSVDEKYCREKIDISEVVIFSILDILIMRKVMNEDDIIILLEERAKKLNKFDPIIFKIRKELQTKEKIESIYELYGAIFNKFEIEKFDIEQLINIELSIQKDVLTKRTKMIELYKYAISQKKEIYLVEDSILPKGFWMAVLDEFEISEYRQIYLSNEYGCSIGTGLINIIKRNLGDKTFVYFGRKQEFSGLKINENVIEIPSALELLSKSSYAEMRFYPTNINERTMLGLFLTRSFSNPFELCNTDGRRKVVNFDDFIYLFISPLIVNYVLWLVNILKREKFDGVLFAARDGYFFNKMYEWLKTNDIEDTFPPNIYFYTSRKAAGNAAIDSEEIISRIFALPYKDSPETVLKKKLQVEDDEIIEYQKTGARNLIEYALLHKKLIYEKSRKQRKNYLSYAKKLKLKENGKYAFFDLGTSGTTLLFLRKIMPFELIGTAFFWYDVFDGEKRELPIQPMYLNSQIDDTNSYNYMIKNEYLQEQYVFLEPIMTSLEPSVFGFDENGKPIFESEPRTILEKERVKRAQDIIMNYFIEFMQYYYIKDVPIGSFYVEQFFTLKDMKYTNESCKELDGYFNRDDLGASKVEIKRR